jgi:Domain of unknown function (DUF4286)
MILFNVTCHIEKSINPAFQDWIKSIYLPKLSENGFVSNATFLKLLTEIDDQTFTYSIQIVFEAMPYYAQFQLENEQFFLEEIQQKFVGKIFTFTTLLEKI